MLIALIADIHGNSVALERILAELESEPPDQGEPILLNPGNVGLEGQADRQTGTVRNPAWAE